MKKEALYIECPRFGGSRPALACVHFDRYKTCRRWCSSLSKCLKSNPNLVEESKHHYDNAPKARLTGLKAKHSGKFVPNPELACTSCKFIAKSPRGLRIHRKRSH